MCLQQADTLLPAYKVLNPQTVFLCNNLQQCAIYQQVGTWQSARRGTGLETKILH